MEKYANKDRIPDAGASVKKIDTGASSQIKSSLKRKRTKVNLNLNTNFDMNKYNDKNRIPDEGAGEKKISVTKPSV